MITRFALFEGHVTPDHLPAFRAAVIARLVPLWRQFPGNSAVRVMFGQERDPGAPEFPLILAISYPDRAAMERALASDVRSQSRDATAAIVADYFVGKIHHHVTEALEFTP